jgi:hypothetical protein
MRTEQARSSIGLVDQFHEKGSADHIGPVHRGLFDLAAGRVPGEELSPLRRLDHLHNDGRRLPAGVVELSLVGAADECGELLLDEVGVRTQSLREVVAAVPGCAVWTA